MHHVPVLAAEAVGLLAPQGGGTYVDATVGLGGHAAAILAAAPLAQVVGIDRDPEALRVAAERLAPYGERARLLAGRFGELDAVLDAAGVGRVDGVLADLGVSSLQLERAERGFSFRREGPLDMRMGGGGPTAAEVVNGYPEAELERILREYGEERDARRIARALVAARATRAIGTTTELREVILRAKGGRTEREGRVDPATRVFQALRIEVNQELLELRRLMEQAVRRLEGGGRLVVISYHSLEDRVVKWSLRHLQRGAVDPVTGRPLAETQLLEALTRKPVRPSDAEILVNPRARSARLRAARRLG